MAQGVVKFFNEERGYGFLRTDDGGPDVFVHVKDVQKSRIGPLKEGDKVTFEVKDAGNGRSCASDLARV